MKHNEFFRKHPVFTGEELSKHLSSHGDVGRRAREALLAYHRKAGRVVCVRRGLYAVIPAGADVDSYPVDLFLVAAKLTPDAEREFLDLLLDRGEIDSTILTSDTILQKRIQGQPLLEWKAINVRRYK